MFVWFEAFSAGWGIEVRGFETGGERERGWGGERIARSHAYFLSPRLS